MPAVSNVILLYILSTLVDRKNLEYKMEYIYSLFPCDFVTSLLFDHFPLTFLCVIKAAISWPLDFNTARICVCWSGPEVGFFQHLHELLQCIWANDYQYVAFQPWHLAKPLRNALRQSFDQHWDLQSFPSYLTKWQQTQLEFYYWNFQQWIE